MSTQAFASREASPGRDEALGGGAALNGAERALALLLLCVALPAVLVLAGGVLLVDGRPAFYRGTRLGRGRRPFTMYKLRTLQRDAETVVGGELLKHSHPLVLRGGSFLRDTRLDELPQLLNVVRGEMSFLGPRPERPEVYRTQCRAIPGYERRFEVRPGLIGSSQLFTPHGTSKRYRTLIDNGALRRGQSLRAGAGVVVFTLWAVLKRTLERAARKLRALPSRLGAGARERRRLRRVAPVGAVARFAGATGAWRVLDLNEEAVLLEGPGALASSTELAFELELALDRGAEQPARRRACCTGRITERRRGERGPRLVLAFRPASERSEYVLHQYFLGTSLAPPRAGWRPVLQPRAARALPPATLPAPRVLAPARTPARVPPRRRAPPVAR